MLFLQPESALVTSDCFFSSILASVDNREFVCLLTERWIRVLDFRSTLSCLKPSVGLKPWSMPARLLESSATKGNLQSSRSLKMRSRWRPFRATKKLKAVTCNTKIHPDVSNHALFKLWAELLKSWVWEYPCRWIKLYATVSYVWNPILDICKLETLSDVTRKEQICGDVMQCSKIFPKSLTSVCSYSLGLRYFWLVGQI